MKPETFIPPPTPIRPEALLRVHGYRRLDEVVPAIAEAAQEMATLAENLVDSIVVHVTRPVVAVEDAVLRLSGGPALHGTCFVSQLPAAREVVCFVATVGGVLDERAVELADDRQLLEAFFLDTAGWLAVEAVVHSFRTHLTRRARRTSLRVSPRLGPGYLDWPLEEQRALFSVFAGGCLPVSLNDYCVMLPKKSTSGLFGLSPLP